MITAGLINKQATLDGVPAATVERDYVLAHVLTGIATHPRATGMIFKGGTALRLCHFDDYRYSADLDFSLAAGTSTEDALGIVHDALAQVAARIELPQLALTDDEPPRIAYRGPLGRERYIKLDLADDELTDTPERRPIFQRYPDQDAADVPAYSLHEVAAEKLRCIIQRVQCRDLFDLHRLLVEEAIDPADVWELFERKSRHRSIDPATFPARLDARIERYRRIWNDELDEHVPGEPPHFDAVEREVRRALRGHL